jgi:hypothetical protein
MTLTAADLYIALAQKGVINDDSFIAGTTPADEYARLITNNGLATAVAGKHLGKVVTFSAAYAHIFQRDLEGRPVRKGRRE